MSKGYIDIFEGFPGVKGFFTFKENAVEGSPYNNPEFLKKLSLDETMQVWPKQIHKNNVAIIEKKQDAPLVIPYTDAVVTNVKNVLLTTVHADCLAVYFYDEKNQAIGLAHAGWRGTAAGISIKTLEKMKEVYGSKAEDMQVYIGPGISRCCFETGPEVYREFKESWDFIDEFAEERYVLKYSQDVKPQIGLSDSKMNLPERESVLKYYLDNKGLNKRQLEISGVKPENIKVSRHCTCCETDLFCSYRREGGTYMRMGAGLCLI